MKFYDLIEQKINKQNLDKLHAMIFDFDYNFYDPLRRNELENKLLRHYMFFDIGFDDLDTFKFYLENYFLTQVETYYNSLYLAQSALKPYQSVGLQTNITDNSNTTRTETSTNKVTTNGGSDITQNGHTQSTNSSSSNGTNNNKQTQTGGTTQTVNNNNSTTNTKSDDTTTANTTNSNFGKKTTTNYDYPVNVAQLDAQSGTSATVSDPYQDSVTSNGTTHTEGNDTSRNEGTTTTTNGVSEDYAVNNNTTTTDENQQTGDVIASNTTNTTNNQTTNGQDERNGNDTTTKSSNVTVSGLTDSMSDEYIRYKTALDNIDLQVINGCRDLFMLVWS